MGRSPGAGGSGGHGETTKLWKVEKESRELIYNPHLLTRKKKKEGFQSKKPKGLIKL